MTNTLALLTFGAPGCYQTQANQQPATSNQAPTRSNQTPTRSNQERNQAPTRRKQERQPANQTQALAVALGCLRLLAVALLLLLLLVAVALVGCYQLTCTIGAFVRLVCWLVDLLVASAGCACWLGWLDWLGCASALDWRFCASL